MRRPRSPQRLKTCFACLMSAVALVGCQQSDGVSADTPATSAGASSGGACDLLESKEVEAVFQGAKRGEVDSSREQYGIFACTWATSRGSFVAQYWDTTGSSAKDEAQGLMLGAVDPLKGAAARNNVRYEDMPGVAPGAVAVIETRDEERGVLTDFALLVAERDDRILVLIAPGLARSARADALKGLESLGKNAVGRLADVAGARKAGASSGAANQATKG